MLSELSPQTAPQWPHSEATSIQVTSADMAEDNAAPAGNIKLKPSHLLVLPVPCLSASPDFLKQLLQDLVLPCSANESGEAQIMVASDSSSFSAKWQMVPYSIPYRIEGISLLVKSAAVSRLTVLSIDNEAEMLRTVREWTESSRCLGA
jgi:hypothetical protein